MFRPLYLKLLSRNYNKSNNYIHHACTLNNDILASRCFHTSLPYEVEGKGLKMPSLSPTMFEGTIVKWLKQEGDTLQPGDLICDIQTDKAVVSLENEEEGILAKILVREDTKDVKIGTLIALIVDEGEDWKNVEMPLDEDDVESASVSSEPESKPHQTSQTKPQFGPSVRLLLEKYSLSAEDIIPSGRHGNVLKGDIIKVVEQKRLQPNLQISAPPPESPSQALPEIKIKTAKSTMPPVHQGDGYSDISHTNMRMTIAKRLTQSKSNIAHTYSTIDCNIDVLLNLRKQLKKDGISVSINDLIIKCVAVALSRCPEVNSVWTGDQLISKIEVDISVAVATDAGLITPIIKGADILGVMDIAEKIRDLAGRARENKLKLDEFQGGTFTISNLGMFGIKEFTAIINPPQCAILAVGGGRTELDIEGKPETRLCATLSYDQQAISDDTAAIFMGIVQDLIENPMCIMLGSYHHVHHPLAALL